MNRDSGTYKVLACLFLFLFAIGFRYANIDGETWPYWALLIGGIGQAILISFKPKKSYYDKEN